MQATAFDPDAPLDERRAVIRRAGDAIEMVELAWGLRPAAPGGRPLRFVRSEGRAFPSHRCLVPASEFHVRRGERSWRCTLVDGDWFYLAGLWRPVTDDWPESYAILTVEANAEVGRYQERQGAVIRRGTHMAWLDLAGQEAELLKPLRARSFAISEITPGGLQPSLGV